MSAAERLFVALDYPSPGPALELVRRLRPLGVRFKVGLELFTAAGPAAVEAVQAEGGPVFLDLKLHDIPHTVAGAARAASRLGVWGVNVHAAGGRAMLEAAVEAVAGSATRLIAVTVLTSVDAAVLAETGGGLGLAERVACLAALAAQAGCQGLVAATADLPQVRAAAPGLFVITPGIRPSGLAEADQKRVGPPSAGGDYLVAGRSITAAPDPVEACRRLLAALGG